MINFIFGAAGFAREVDWLVEEIYYASRVDYRPQYFVAEDTNVAVGQLINGRRVLSETEFYSGFSKEMCQCFIAVGNPTIRSKIVDGIKNKVHSVKFPNLIHPDVTFDKRADKLTLGEGNIICSKNVLTTDILIANFAHINLACTVGHDTTVGNYVTLSPGVNISGYVNLGNQVFLGTGSSILERINICDETVIGAGATVVQDITLPGTYVGTPAKKMK